MIARTKFVLRLLGLSLLLLAGIHSFAADSDYPEKPNPPRLVNDYAHILNAGQVNQLEQKLDNFVATTSNQISIVVIPDLKGHDVEEYAVEVFNRWALGDKDKKNGVLLLVAINDRKAWISTGQGLQGVLTDGKSGEIFRNEIVPAFKEGNYYQGLSNASDAIISVTKGEYKGNGIQQKQQHIPITGIIIVVIFIIFILRMFRGGGGGGGGNYMSGGGIGNFMTGMFLGNMLGGGFGRGGGGGSDWGGGGDSGGGGFGGFGGGSTDGGGAGGSW